MKDINRLIRLLHLKFDDNELESKFYDDYIDKSLPAIRGGFILAIILYVAFGVLDIWMVPYSKKIIWSIRFLFVCPALVIAFILTYTNFFRNNMQLIPSVTSIIVGVGVVLMIAISKKEELGYSHYYAGLFLVIIWIYTFLRLRFIYAIISALIILISYEIVIIFLKRMLDGGLHTPEFTLFLSNNFFFLSANICGVVACYLIESYNRKDFLQRIDIKKAYEDLKYSQEQLVQSEKMASLGQLVAGVAHEINTPIGVGVTAASILVSKVEEILSLHKNNSMKKSTFETFLSNVSETSNLILKNLLHTDNLIRSFKMVTADQTSQDKRSFNLNLYIKDIILSLTPKIKKTHHQIKIACPETIEMYGSPGALAQIITNLLLNSFIHAYVDDQRGDININVRQEKDNVIITFSDNGCGIPKENLKKIFDPFFTTARSKGGTGLGLHIVYNIVCNTMKGKILCESTVGEGTTFTVILPSMSA
ncbi:sensor histidine kinase [Candidatus Magnetobacterium casense]|uniref:histidine kinase n=1 Tax=Candidatus Magnetobacterium casense TaxID=1455061 RepID=A0ABS6RX90_9BACT|nr:HAMP domain-containing sensor histidine kinase [Candidatus Magnetobacterium casensis]MBV6340868.1 HAMP domain-containing histidine kinase [Candidatus Magnetobacterium casensis]